MSRGSSSIAAPRGSATTLSSTTWRQLWRTSRQQACPVDQDDTRDRIAQYPAHLATGYKRDIDLRNGVGLTLHRYQFHQDLIVTQWPEEDTGCLEFVFNLSSISKYREGPYLTAGQHCLMGVYHPGCQQVVELAQEPTLAVDIYMHPRIFRQWLGLDTHAEPLQQLQRLPKDLQRLLAGDTQIVLSPIQTITPAMQVALRQILDCPYHGVVKHLYLESKTLELLVLWLEQVFSLYDSASLTHQALPSADLERIHHAKEILVRQLHNPPSLVELARRVGLNDCTLKRQFRQVFGTTVFGYLHDCRMEQARTLLRENQLSISAIAHTIGYSNPCAFSTAFRKKFGVSPRAMRQ